MNLYRAFALSIASELLIPELVLAPDLEGMDDKIDVHVRYGKVRDVLWSPQAGLEHDTLIEPQKAYLYWEPVGTFAVLEGREIWVDANPTASPDLVRMPLLGAVIATLLEQRGDFVLHAGAVEITRATPSHMDGDAPRVGGATVFLGWKGAGKSTMTAALWKAGHRLLSDDVVAIRNDSEGKPWVYPGFPQFKLWPASAEGALGENPQDLPELHEDTEKKARLAFEGFSLEPAPLLALFALDPILPDEAAVANVEIHSLSFSERMAQLIAHSYAARWGNDLLRGAGGSEHFRRCAQLAATVPVLSLRRRMEMSLLPQVVSAVEDFVVTASSQDADSNSMEGVKEATPVLAA